MQHFCKKCRKPCEVTDICSDCLTTPTFEERREEIREILRLSDEERTAMYGTIAWKFLIFNYITRADDEILRWGRDAAALAGYEFTDDESLRAYMKGVDLVARAITEKPTE